MKWRQKLKRLCCRQQACHWRQQALDPEPFAIFDLIETGRCRDKLQSIPWLVPTYNRPLAFVLLYKLLKILGSLISSRPACASFTYYKSAVKRLHHAHSQHWDATTGGAVLNERPTHEVSRQRGTSASSSRENLPSLQQENIFKSTSQGGSFKTKRFSSDGGLHGRSRATKVSQPLRWLSLPRSLAFARWEHFIMKPNQ